MSILSKMNHTVNVIHITRSAGSRTETSTDSGIKCSIVHRRRLERGVSEDRVVHDTVIYFPPTTTINDGDEVLVDGVKRTISAIKPARHPRSMSIRFYEVTLG